MKRTITSGYRVGADIVLAWIVVCATVPVLMGIAAIAFNKEILHADPHATLVSNTMLATMVCLPILCASLQWYALNRFAPRLALWMWAGAVTVGLVSSAFLLSWLRLPDASVPLRIWNSSDATSFSLAVRVMLGFAKVIGIAVLFSVTTSLAQTLLLSRATQQSWKIFLIAAIAGAGAEATIAHVPDLLGILRWEKLNGLSWSSRLVELALRGCAGASYGIASAIVIFRKLMPAGAASESRKSGSILSLTALMVICVPVSIAIIGRDGGRSAGFAMLKAFTVSPAKDLSHGEEILRYSHQIETLPGRYPVIDYSPDSRYLIVLDRQRRVMLVEVSSGRQLGQIGDALPLDERYAIAWSPDSKAIVIGTKGAEDAVPATQYTLNGRRLRKYSVPALELRGEYLTAHDECHESFAQRSLIYVPAGDSFWILCGSRSPAAPETTMAIQLDAESMRPLRRTSYGMESVAGMVETLGISDGEVVYLQHRSHESADEVRLGRLHDGAADVRTHDLNAAGHTSGLTSQGEVIQEGRFVADYCGEPAAAEGANGKSICRKLVVETDTGKILLVSDDVDRRFERYRQAISMRDSLRVEGRQHPSSAKAEILVVDEPSGRVRQRIETWEQRPLAFAPDEHWLVTFSPGKKRLSIYRVN